MPKKLQSIVDALIKLGDSIFEANQSDTTLRSQYGWNFPNLTSKEMANYAYRLSEKIEKIDDSQITEEINTELIVNKITQDHRDLIQYFWNGNGSDAFKSYIFTMSYVELSFSTYFSVKVDWEKLSNEDQLPSNLARKARNVQSRLNNAEKAVDQIDSKISTINNAHAAALALPTDLESLGEARDLINNVLIDTQRQQGIIAKYNEDSKFNNDIIANLKSEAEQLVARVEDAYSAATTMGLGASFETKAKQLTYSMWIWVIGLVGSLSAGSWIASNRIRTIEQMLSTESSPTAMLIHTLLSGFSVAAPIWFAWIATKQIGQRFRLAEDYGFKASFAKAYEGYRREAANIDPSFAARLFSSALDRLDEAPLRFVEHESHGSLWHEALKLNRVTSTKTHLDRPVDTSKTNVGVSKMPIESNEDNQVELETQ